MPMMTSRLITHTTARSNTVVGAARSNAAVVQQWMRCLSKKPQADAERRNRRRLRSAAWFDDPTDPGMTALYIERYLNFGLTRQELQSGRPIIGIAQTGSDLSPCNRVHVGLAQRVRDGIRDAGGIPFEFPCHPIQETGRRPTAALDRNLSYMTLTEILHGYPLDGVVLTTGCDKTTPALLMAAATSDLPAIVLSGGPMLDGWWKGDLAGSGAVIWDSRRRLAAGEIDQEEFFERVCSSAPSEGHCNTMGTASTMNALAEALGMSLTGCASIPAPYRERGQIAYLTGIRAVELVHEDLRPSAILTREAFLNAIRVNSALGGSTNAPPHLQAIARHAGVKLSIEDWQTFGYDIPLLVNMQPAGKYLGESFHRAGGVPAVMGELLTAGLIDGSPQTVTGTNVEQNLAGRRTLDTEVIRSSNEPLRLNAGFRVIKGNLFESALMKTSVISKDFADRYLLDGVFEANAVVFEGPEDYHMRINDPDMAIDEKSILFIRNVGPIGYPGSAEVVNMQPPDTLLARGVTHLPTVGDGRQSGTSESPSILNASPEAVAGGGLAIIQTGDRVRLDLQAGTLNLLQDEAEISRRWRNHKAVELTHESPWQEIHRSTVGQLSTGGCMELATRYHRIAAAGKVPRHNH